MTHWELYAVLIAAFGIAGCSARSTPGQAGSATSQPSGPSSQAGRASTQAGRASSQPSGPPGQPGEFFLDPQVAALVSALERSDWGGAERVLRAGAGVNTIGKDHMCPLIWTMYVKNKAAFEWLLNHGADPNLNSGDRREGYVLFWAAVANDPDWLRILLAHKANPNLTHETGIGTTETPLLAAIDQYRLTNVKMLIAAGADVNYQQDGGVTPAISAAMGGMFEGVYELLKAGADFRQRTTGGADLTYWVARYRIDSSDPRFPGREKVLQLLRERGADVDGALRTASDEAAQDRKDNPWRYH